MINTSISNTREGKVDAKVNFDARVPKELPPRPETYTDRHAERIKPGEDAAAVRYIAALESRLRAVPVEERTAIASNETPPCPICKAPVFIRDNGAIVAHLNGDGRRCAANETFYFPKPQPIPEERTKVLMEALKAVENERLECHTKYMNPDQVIGGEFTEAAYSQAINDAESAIKALILDYIEGKAKAESQEVQE